MKKSHIIITSLAVLALSSCTINDLVSAGNELFGDQTGVVTEEATKKNVRKVYSESIENTEELETLTDEDEPTGEEVPDEEQPGSVDEGNVEGSEVVPEETEEQPITDVITSYHVDYTYEYGLKASIHDYQIINQSEIETYSLTYVQEENGVFLDMSMTHSYKENDYYFGTQTVHAIYQDDVLYVTASIDNGGYYKSEYKESFEIRRGRVYKEFGDFFRYTYLDLLFVSGSKQDSYSLLDTLLEAENVEIVDVDETTVTMNFDYDGIDASIKFNTELSTVVSATFDESAILLESLNNKNHGELQIDEAILKVTANYSYNDQIANRLTDEEIETYAKHHGHNDYGHKNDHSYYGDDKRNGNHDHDDWGDYPGQPEDNPGEEHNW